LLFNIEYPPSPLIIANYWKQTIYLDPMC